MKFMRFFYLVILADLFFSCLALSCNKLTPSEIVKVQYEHRGCFGSTKTTISFFTQDSLVFAGLHEGQTYKMTPVTETHMNTLSKFIFLVKSLKKENGCTSSIKYLIYTRSEIIESIDDGCQDTGFEELRDIFFIVDPLLREL